MMRCQVCGKGPMDNPPTDIFRINEKGIPGIYVCETHKLTPIDPVIQLIREALAPGPP